MKRTLVKVTSLTALSLFLLVSAASASPRDFRGKRGEMFKKASFPAVMEQLNLSEQQKQELKEQKYQLKRKKIEIRNKIALKRLELRHELHKKDTNKKVVTKIAQDLKNLQANMVDFKIEGVLKFKSILTPEQLSKFETLPGGMRYHGDGGPRRGMGQGPRF
jgi:Spy/CpxP family protein refolding chaperone